MLAKTFDWKSKYFLVYKSFGNISELLSVQFLNFQVLVEYQ